MTGAYSEDWKLLIFDRFLLPNELCSVDFIMQCRYINTNEIDTIVKSIWSGPIDIILLLFYFSITYYWILKRNQMPNLPSSDKKTTQFIIYKLCQGKDSEWAKDLPRTHWFQFSKTKYLKTLIFNPNNQTEIHYHILLLMTKKECILVHVFFYSRHLALVEQTKFENISNEICHMNVFRKLGIFDI